MTFGPNRGWSFALDSKIRALNLFYNFVVKSCPNIPTTGIGNVDDVIM